MIAVTVAMLVGLAYLLGMLAGGGGGYDTYNPGFGSWGQVRLTWTNTIEFEVVDEVTVDDTVSGRISALSASVEDSVTLTEAGLGRISTVYLQASDSALVEDLPTVSVFTPLYGADVSDEITVSESVSVTLEGYFTVWVKTGAGWVLANSVCAKIGAGWQAVSSVSTKTGGGWL